ncbi:hypothetical protein PtA15_18A55 [Puccinia triticina]|uniref:Hydrophobin n=1 Tax=Puccinia triticina TaxID=208348 RepID=A0ABY7D5R5_9BASI|nr:uncharacterized protein PtA15_18A55 [Puccinia triticina]WAQ92999.1 hypothetical protein PtA15_18A55 [Puccinia triticina]
MATPQVRLIPHQHQPDISSPTTFKIPNKDPSPQTPSQHFNMRFTIAAAMSLALLNSVSANMLGSLLQPTSLFAVPGSIFDQQNGQVSCGNQGHAAINANVLTQVQCGGSGGTQMSCGNQGNAAVNLNALTSINCCHIL